MTKPAFPAISNLPAPIQRAIAPVYEQLTALAQQSEAAERRVTTLEELLRGSKATRTVQGQFALPPVSRYRVNTFPNYIAIYLESTQATSNLIVELWRGIDGSGSDSALLVQETTRFALEDHPPPGEAYRYWLRYRSLDGTQFGPFSPAQGIQLVTQEPVNPEDLFDPNNGGVFLETFESENLASRWTARISESTAVTYPLSGVVGGKVARIEGGEEWRVYYRRFEYDPSVLYRMKIGLRLSSAPSNGALSARAMVLAGFECYNENGVLVDTAGGTGFALAHFFAAFERNLGSGGVGTYVEYEGYIRGLGASPANNADDVAVPSVARNGARYFAPMWAVNYDGGNGTTEIDYIRIDALTPYSLAVSGILTNENVSLPADSSGAVLSYAPATGRFVVYFGLTELDPSNVVFAITANPQALTATINASGEFAVTAGFDQAEPFAEITFTATFAGVTIERKLTLTKSIPGDPGPPGSADVLTGYVTRPSWSILVGQDGTPIAAAFDAAEGYFRTFFGGAEVTSSTTFAVVQINATGTINTDVNTPVNGEVRGYYNVTAMSADVGVLELSATYSGQTVRATFTVTKERIGYEIVATLPVSGNYVGRIVFLTTDNRLYRWTGSAWTAAVNASDVTGLLTASQIDTIAAAQLTGQLVAAQIASITAPQITGLLTASQIDTINAAQVAGQLSAAQIASIAAAQITGQLTAGQIASITAAQLTGQITTTQIANNAITTPQLAAGSVTAAQIQANTITAAQIAAGTITATQLAAGSVTAAQMTAGAVVAGVIAAGAVTAGTIAAGAITAAEIAVGTITGNRIAANTITGDNIAANSISGTRIQAGSITALEIAAGAIVAGKIAAGVITAAEIAAGTITAGQIAALSITTPLLAANAVTAAKIDALAVTTDKIDVGAVTAAKIAANTITAAQIAAGTITATEIQVGSITGDRIVANSINGDRIVAGTLTAAAIQVGTITADRLVLGGIDTDRIAPGATVGFQTGSGQGTFTNIGYTVRATAAITPVDANSTVVAMFSAVTIIGDAAPVNTLAQARLMRNGILVWGPTQVSASRGVPIPVASFVTAGGATGLQTYTLEFNATAAAGLGDPHSVENARIVLMEFKR